MVNYALFFTISGENSPMFVAFSLREWWIKCSYLLITFKLYNRGISHQQVLFEVPFFLTTHINSLLNFMTPWTLWFRGPSDKLSVGFFSDRTFILSGTPSWLWGWDHLGFWNLPFREYSPSLKIPNNWRFPPAALSAEDFIGVSEAWAFRH